MAQDASGAGTAAVGTALVIPGEMAARVDRLPRSWMAWEICLIVQVGWAIAASTDGIAAAAVPVRLAARQDRHSLASTTSCTPSRPGSASCIGGYAIGWLADKIGRRKALIISAALAGVFIWPFAYVTNYPALIVLSIADTLGFAGFLAINVVYMSEIMGPTVRPRVMMVSQVSAIFVLGVILTGIIPHYWFPAQYKQYLWLLAGLNIAGRGAAVLPDARIAALAGGPGTPRPGAPGRGADGGAGHEEAPRAARTCRRTRWWPRRRPAGWRRSASSTRPSPSCCWWSWPSATPASCTAVRARPSCSCPSPAATAPASSSPSRPGVRWSPPRLPAQRVRRRPV